MLYRISCLSCALLVVGVGPASAADPAPTTVSRVLSLPTYPTSVALKPHLAGVDPGTAAEASLTIVSSAVGDEWSISCTTAGEGTAPATTVAKAVSAGETVTLRKAGERTTCDLGSLHLAAASSNDARTLEVTLDKAVTEVALQGAVTATRTRLVTQTNTKPKARLVDGDFDAATWLPVPTAWLALPSPSNVKQGANITIYAEVNGAAVRVESAGKPGRRASYSAAAWNAALAKFVADAKILPPKDGAVGTGTVEVSATDGETRWELGRILVGGALPDLTPECVQLRLHVDSLAGALDNAGRPRKMPVRSASHLKRLGIAAGGRSVCDETLAGQQFVVRLALGPSDATTGYPKTEGGLDNVFESAPSSFPDNSEREKANFNTLPFAAIYQKLRANAPAADQAAIADIADAAVDGEYTLYASVDIVDLADPEQRRTVVQDQALVALVDYDPTVTIAAITHPAGTGFGVVQCRDIVDDGADIASLTDPAQRDCVDRPDVDRISGALGTTPLGLQFRWSPLYHQPWFGVASQLNATTFGLATTLDTGAPAANISSAAAGITDLASATVGLSLKLTDSKDYDPKAPEFHMGAGAALLSTVEGFKVRPFFGLSYTVILEASKNSNTGSTTAASSPAATPSVSAAAPASSNIKPNGRK